MSSNIWLGEPGDMADNTYRWDSAQIRLAKRFCFCLARLGSTRLSALRMRRCKRERKQYWNLKGSYAVLNHGVQYTVTSVWLISKESGNYGYREERTLQCVLSTLSSFRREMCAETYLNKIFHCAAQPLYIWKAKRKRCFKMRFRFSSQLSVILKT